MSEAAVQTALRPARLVFVKLIAIDLAAMTAFYERAFGLEAVRTIEMEGLKEVVLQRPGDAAGPSLILYHYTDGRPISVGSAHGPVGLAVRDVDAAFAQALAVGASPVREPFEVPGMRVAFVNDPEGHEIELVSFKG